MTCGVGSDGGAAAAVLGSTGGGALEGTALASVPSEDPRSASAAAPAPSKTNKPRTDSTSGAADFFLIGSLECESPRCAVVEASGSDAACATPLCELIGGGAT